MAEPGDNFLDSVTVWNSSFPRGPGVPWGPLRGVVSVLRRACGVWLQGDAGVVAMKPLPRRPPVCPHYSPSPLLLSCCVGSFPTPCTG